MKRLLRYLFGKCDYCGKLLRKGGGKGFGTAHKVYYGISQDSVIQYACLNCEMCFDED
jgi:hypothetical protein